MPPLPIPELPLAGYACLNTMLALVQIADLVENKCAAWHSFVRGFYLGHLTSNVKEACCLHHSSYAYVAVNVSKDLGQLLYQMMCMTNCIGQTCPARTGPPCQIC